MKKVVYILLFMALLFSLTACVDKTSRENSIPLVEEYEWVMRYTQKVGGEVVAYGTDKYTPYEDAKEIELKASAENGVIKIFDLTNDAVYEGEYIKSDRTPESQNYKFVFDTDDSGFGLTAMTKYYDGETYSETATLIINAGEYALVFEAEK